MSLLQVPPNIRFAIYTYAGVFGTYTPRCCSNEPDSPNAIPRTCAGDRELSDIINVNLNHRPPSPDLGLHKSATFSLLLSCSAVYAELAQYLYSHCQFVIRAKDDANLSALRRLRPSSIRVLRRLTIDLNATSCGYGWTCDDAADPPLPCDEDSAYSHIHEAWNHEASPRKPDSTIEPLQVVDERSDSDRSLLSMFDHSQPQSLTATNEVHKTVLQNWHQVWADLRLHLPFATLELDFTCDVADVETGELAVKPFLTETQPFLAKCNIRLARRKVEPLRKLARLAVDRIVYSKKIFHSLPQTTRRSDSTTFTDLPAEIRQHILQYTDLVVPDKEVEWSPYRGWYLRRGGQGVNEIRNELLLHLHPIAKDKSKTVDDAHQFTRNAYSRHCCQEKLGGRGCFCKSRHSVYSSYSMLSCWAPPTPFFLVNSIVRKDSLQVFFGQNRIVVWPSKGFWYPGIAIHPPCRLHISRFLGDVVPKDALRHLRCLEVVFEQLQGMEHLTWCTTGSLELLDWQRTIEKVKPHFVASKLAMEVVFPSDENRMQVHYPEDTTIYPKEEFQHRKTCYFNAVLPLQQLRCHLKRLSISWYEDMKESGFEAESNGRWGHELVRKIMGPAYDHPHASYEDDLDRMPALLFMRCARWKSDLQYHD